MDDILKEEINAIFSSALENADPVALNESYLLSHENSLPHIVAGKFLIFFIQSGLMSIFFYSCRVDVRFGFEHSAEGSSNDHEFERWSRKSKLEGK